jgi:general stress protein 26
MISPVTTLDQRFSDPKAEPITWEETKRAIEISELFWLTTVRADGRPHSTPVVAVWDDGALHFTAGSEEQKSVNLRTNAHVLLTTGCNDWREGVDIVVEGEALQTTDQVMLERLVEAWHAKWDGRWEYSARDGHFYHSAGFEVLAFSVVPIKVLAFAKGTFGHTVHRFQDT